MTLERTAGQIFYIFRKYSLQCFPCCLPYHWTIFYGTKKDNTVPQFKALFMKTKNQLHQQVIQIM